MGKGLVSPQVSGAPTTAAKSPHPLRYHFSSFPLGLARAIFSRPVLAAAALVIMSAALAALRRPAVIPNWRALVFDRHVPAMVLAMIAANFLITSLHEIAHLIAARARGVPSRFGLGHRLWVLVAETDLSGLWALPASERYLPLVAGALLDLVSASTLVLVLFVWQAGILALSLPAGRVLSALLYIYMLRLLWQLFFFVRTDLYYVLATAFDCKNLMGDTVTFLKSKVARLLARPQADQSHIPRHELKVIHAYAWIWLAGRGLALFVLSTITLPLLLAYGAKITDVARGLITGTSHPAAGSVAALLFTFTFGVVGLAVWVRSLLARRGVD